MTLVPFDDLEQSYIANLNELETRLAAANNDAGRMEVRDAARAAQVVAAATGRQELVRQFSVLVQRAERAIAKANPPRPRGGDRQSTSGDRLTPNESNERSRFRAAHDNLPDAEFEALAQEPTLEPMTRQGLIARSRHLETGTGNNERRTPRLHR